MGLLRLSSIYTKVEGRWIAMHVKGDGTVPGSRERLHIRTRCASCLGVGPLIVMGNSAQTTHNCCVLKNAFELPDVAITGASHDLVLKSCEQRDQRD